MGVSKTSYIVAKRVTDISLASLAIVLGSPLAVVIAIGIRLDGPGPVLFRQERAGQHGRVFTMYKFRTMRIGNHSSLIPDMSVWSDGVPDDFVFKTGSAPDPRITRVGRLLRRTSLDEFPQFINVVKGEMSLVGPRPEILPIVERYSPKQAIRLRVKPGITGWAQINGRAEVSHSDKIAADLYYVASASLRLDFFILVRTAVSAVIGRGAF